MFQSYALIYVNLSMATYWETVIGNKIIGMCTLIYWYILHEDVMYERETYSQQKEEACVSDVTCIFCMRTLCMRITMVYNAHCIMELLDMRSSVASFHHSDIVQMSGLVYGYSRI